MYTFERAPMQVQNGGGGGQQICLSLRSPIHFQKTDAAIGLTGLEYVQSNCKFASFSYLIKYYFHA